MKSLYYFHILIFLLLFILFFWECSLSTIKFLSGKTSYFNTIKDMERLLYPSVTVCKKYTFDDYLDNMFFNKPINLTEIKQVAIKYSWDIEEVFYFLTHPNMLDLNFPCTTKPDGTDPGKPCVFPFKGRHYDNEHNYYESTEEGCFNMQTTSPACFTRTTENLTNYYINGAQFWGYCSEACKGEKADPGSKYNLAKKQFSTIWKSEFFDLRTWESGLCHTYNPPEKSSHGGFKNRLYFMLGRILAKT